MLADLRFQRGLQKVLDKRHHRCHRISSQHRAYRRQRGGLPMAIETFTPHQLRHTFCTLMYFAGVSVLTARDQMGHKDISVTLGIYTALDKKFKKKKINRLDAYLKKAT